MLGFFSDLCFVSFHLLFYFFIFFDQFLLFFFIFLSQLLSNFFIFLSQLLFNSLIFFAHLLLSLLIFLAHLLSFLTLSFHLSDFFLNLFLELLYLFLTLFSFCLNFIFHLVDNDLTKVLILTHSYHLFLIFMGFVFEHLNFNFGPSKFPCHILIELVNLNILI